VQQDDADLLGRDPGGAQPFEPRPRAMMEERPLAVLVVSRARVDENRQPAAPDQKALDRDDQQLRRGIQEAWCKPRGIRREMIRLAIGKDLEGGEERLFRFDDPAQRHLADLQLDRHALSSR